MTPFETLKTYVKTYRSWVAGGASVLVFALILLLARGVGSADMALLYSGLDDQTAGEVIAALETQGATYEVRGASIFVTATERDILRLQLAGEGLPRATTQGYELLDSLSGFGTTAQMFDAAYWRAKEGELARTILASPNIRAARVHISSSNARPFGRTTDVSAAVTVTTNGMTPAAKQVQSLQFLVAAAVAGLSPDDVAIIDSSGGLLNGEINDFGNDRAAALRDNVLRLLEAHVGFGNAVVEVSIDTVTDTEQIIERHYDPETRVAISSDVQESTSASSDSRGGDVTVASNLPQGDGATGGASNGETSQTRTLTNYEVSETQREIHRAAGAIRRMTVAVLVNDMATGDPRSTDELTDLRDLVASAVGFDEARGDVITLRSLPFEANADLGADAAIPIAPPLNMMRLIQIGALALVTITIGLFVVRPVLLPQRALPAPRVDDEPETLPKMVLIENAEDPAERLRKLIGERQKESLHILQSWVDAPERKAGA